MGPRPRNGFVLLRLLAADETKSGIIIPAGVAPPAVRGIVMHVEVDLDLDEGDEVVYLSNHGSEVKIGGEDLVLIHEKHIVAVTDPVAAFRT